MPFESWTVCKVAEILLGPILIGTPLAEYTASAVVALLLAYETVIEDEDVEIVVGLNNTYSRMSGSPLLVRVADQLAGYCIE